MRTDRERILIQAINGATAVFIVFFIVALFLWFLPLISTKFMIYEYEYGVLVMRWFASSVAQIERAAVTAYIIFGFPLMTIFSYFALKGTETIGNA